MHFLGLLTLADADCATLSCYKTTASGQVSNAMGSYTQPAAPTPPP